MTATRLREVLVLLDWSINQLARILGTNKTTVQRWADGERSVPPVVADWLEALALVHAANPVPRDWRRPRGPKPTE